MSMTTPGKDLGDCLLTDSSELLVQIENSCWLHSSHSNLVHTSVVEHHTDTRACLIVELLYYEDQFGV